MHVVSSYLKARNKTLVGHLLDAIARIFSWIVKIENTQDVHPVDIEQSHKPLDVLIQEAKEHVEAAILIEARKRIFYTTYRHTETGVVRVEGKMHVLNLQESATIPALSAIRALTESEIETVIKETHGDRT